MNKVSKKIFSSIMAMGCVLTLTACKTSLKKYNGEGVGGTAANVITFNHYDGIGTLDHERDPGVNEATIDRVLYFISDDTTGGSPEAQTHRIGYQVTYVACNCRSASFNASTTIYVEFSATQRDLDDTKKATIEKIVFEGPAFEDDYGHPTYVGHWGDSIAMDKNNNMLASEHGKEHGYLGGVVKEDFYDEIIPLLDGVSNETLDSWIEAAVDEEGKFHHEDIEVFETTMVDRYDVKLFSDGTLNKYDNKHAVSINEAYSGASVSLDNMLNLIDALFDYHAKELTKIKNDPSFNAFYADAYAGLDFTGEYVLEADTTGEITRITGADLANMTSGAYLIYGASDGCSSCAKFKKPAQKYVEAQQRKVYEVLLTDAQAYYGSTLAGLTAPQMFLVVDGEIVAIMDKADVTTASNTASWKVIHKSFTQTLVSPNVR